MTPSRILESYLRTVANQYGSAGVLLLNKRLLEVYEEFKNLNIGKSYPG